MEKTGIRRAYMWRLAGRCVILAACALLCAFRRAEFEVIRGMNFFRRFSALHLLWLVWMADMFFQLIPVKRRLPLGSQKLFRHRFRPIREKINYPALRRYVKTTTRAAYLVLLIWAALIALLGILRHGGYIGDIALFMLSVVFYVCDLVCVLIWCPFRLILKNRCCTTCRIFNWDHLMMFTPLIFVKGFYCRTLLAAAFAAFLLWELCVFMYPERFWENSNLALQCSECTDKLCTQYCRKLR